MPTERNLLFGAFCVKFGLITLDQLVSAMWDWTGRSGDQTASLAQFLEAKSLIRAAQREQIDRVIAERLVDFDGDPHKALSDVIDEESLVKLVSIVGKELQQTLTLIEPLNASKDSTADSKTSSQDWNSGSTQQRYRLAEETGRGGLGQVWIARDLDLNRRVALKTIKPTHTLNHDILSRFVREAQITGQLEHPNVIRVYELSPGSTEQRPYFSMQLIRDKRTLRTAIHEYHESRRAGTANPVEFSALLSAFVSICQAIGYAHSRGVLHRDLKPQNVMLGRYGEAIVIDWGLAKFEAQTDASLSISQIDVTDDEHIEETRSGQILGTPAYMPPEQASGQLDLVDARSDIYGLGAILFEILVGRPPHQHRKNQKMPDLLQEIAELPAPSARHNEPNTPTALDAVCSKAMSKRREDRYQKATDLADDMRRWLAGEPVSVYSEPWRDRLFRWLRKHRAAATSGAIALTTVALVAAVAAVFINRARGREAVAKLVAVERLSEAEHAVDVSLTGINEVLKFYPSAQSVRQRLLEQAAADYARFAAVQSDDLRLQLEAARAQLRLANVRLQLEQFDKAIAEFDAADRRLSALESKLPAATFERGIAAAQRADALHRAGRRADAKPVAQQSLEWLERGVIALPTDSPRRIDLADARLIFARILHQLGDPAAARQQLDQAIKQVERDSSPAVQRDARRIAAKAEHEIAQLEMSANHLSEAEGALGRALKHYATLLSSEKNYPVWLDGQSLCRVTLANLQRRQGRDVEALNTYQKAVGDFDDLARAIPGVPHYDHVRILSRTDAALLRLALGQAPAARDLMAPTIERLIQLADGTESPPDLVETAAMAHATYGAALRDLGEGTAAEDAFLVSRELFEKLPKEHLRSHARRQAAVVVGQLARLTAELGQLDDAIQLFRKADDELQSLIADDDNDASSKSRLAALCQHWGDVLADHDRRDEATQLFGRARTLWLDLPDEVDLQIGQLWLLLTCPDESVRDPRLAVAIADKLLARAPDNVRVLALLGLAKSLAGETDVAERTARQSLRLLAAGNSTAHFVLALVEHQRGRKDEALEAFQAGVREMTEQHPGSWSARRLRDFVAKETGQP